MRRRTIGDTDSAPPRARQGPTAGQSHTSTGSNPGIAPAARRRSPGLVFRRISAVIPLCFLLTLAALTGCSSKLSRAHRPNLLDDKVTTQRVEAALQAAGPEFSNVHVQTAGGVVTLTGTVPSRQTQSRAEQLVNSVHRSTAIEDNLQVRQ